MTIREQDHLEGSEVTLCIMAMCNIDEVMRNPTVPAQLIFHTDSAQCFAEWV